MSSVAVALSSLIAAAARSAKSSASRAAKNANAHPEPDPICPSEKNAPLPPSILDARLSADPSPRAKMKESCAWNYSE